MRSILALTVLLLALLALIGPEGGPEASRSCATASDEVCLGEGRLKVRVRGTLGRELGGGAAGFGFADSQALDVVVRIEPATVAGEGSSEEAGAPPLNAFDEDLQGGAADRIFIGSLSSQEIWVEVTDLEHARTRIYHRPAGAGWGLVDVLPRGATSPLRVASAD